MIKTNGEYLPIQSVQGKIQHPALGSPYQVGRDGIGRVLTPSCGIIYNAKLGDNCMKWVADHLEPGVSIQNEKTQENEALNHFACIGNEAAVVTGEAKGAKGFVTGKHGGINNVLAYFPHSDLLKMAVGDSVLIRAVGQGLVIDGFPDVFCCNIAPDLLCEIGIEEKNNMLEIPVAFEIPPELTGSGIGSLTGCSGDFDITTGDPRAVESLNLQELRFGDIILLKDLDSSYGHEYRKGAVTIGVVVHGDSADMGHGPGVTAIMSCANGRIKGRATRDANIASCLLNIS